jgi:hypothetical protein
MKRRWPPQTNSRRKSETLDFLTRHGPLLAQAAMSRGPAAEYGARGLPGSNAFH